VTATSPPVRRAREKADEFLRHTERNQIAEILLIGKIASGWPLSPSGNTQRAHRIKSRVHKMRVVKDRVTEAPSARASWAATLPRRARPARVPEGSRRDGGAAQCERSVTWPTASRSGITERIGFVEPAAEDLDLVGHDELREPVQERRLLSRTTPATGPCSAASADVRVPLQEIEEWPVAALVGLAEGHVEVPTGGVYNAEQQLTGCTSGPPHGALERLIGDREGHVPFRGDPLEFKVALHYPHDEADLHAGPNPRS